MTALQVSLLGSQAAPPRPFCKHESETIEHLFPPCEWTDWVWKGPFEEIASLLWFIWKESKKPVRVPKQNPNFETTYSAQSTEIWIPPKQRTFKINVDGAFWEGGTEGVVARVLRDETGALLDGFAIKIPASSANQTEALAVAEALKKFESMGEKTIVLESDSAEAINQVLKETRVSWDLEPFGGRSPKPNGPI